MAYSNTQEEEEEGTPGQETGPESGTVSSGQLEAGGSSPLASGQKEKNPGNFVGIKQYLDQNKNQAAGLGNTVQGYVNEQADTAKNQLTDTENNFNKAVDDNTVNYNSDLTGQAKQNASGIVNDPSKMQEFQRMRAGQYAGPQSFEGTDYYQPAQNAVKKVTDITSGLGTNAGVMQTLKDIQGKKEGQEYTPGIATFDTALLGGSPEAQNSIQQSQSIGKNLQDYLGQLNTKAGQKIQSAKDKSQTTAKQVSDEFTGDQGYINQLKAQEQNKLAQDRANAGNLINESKNISSSGLSQISPQLRQALGLSDDQFSGLSQKEGRLKELGGSFDFGKYLTSQDPNQNITLENDTSPEEKAQAAALSSLFGQDSWLSGNQGTINPGFNISPNANADLNAQLKNAEINDVSKKAGDKYYEQIGERTGQGYSGGYNGRDTVKMIQNLLGQNRGMNEDEQRRYYGYANTENTQKEIQDMLDQARGRIQNL